MTGGDRMIVPPEMAHRIQGQAILRIGMGCVLSPHFIFPASSVHCSSLPSAPWLLICILTILFLCACPTTPPSWVTGFWLAPWGGFSSQKCRRRC